MDSKILSWFWYGRMTKKQKQKKPKTLFVIYLANQLTLYSLSKNEHIKIIKLEPI